MGDLPWFAQVGGTLGVALILVVVGGMTAKWLLAAQHITIESARAAKENYDKQAGAAWDASDRCMEELARQDAAHQAELERFRTYADTLKTKLDQANATNAALRRRLREG